RGCVEINHVATSKGIAATDAGNARLNTRNIAVARSATRNIAPTQAGGTGTRRTASEYPACQRATAIINATPQPRGTAGRAAIAGEISETARVKAPSGTTHAINGTIRRLAGTATAPPRKK